MEKLECWVVIFSTDKRRGCFKNEASARKYLEGSLRNGAPVRLIHMRET